VKQVEEPEQEVPEDFLALSPFKESEWRALTPRERLARAWALRRRLPNAQEVHDRKLFPAP
jgi:hypothetical protein